MTESRTVLVTGASRGIGQAIALAFARAGYTVIGTATGERGKTSILSALSTYGDSHKAYLLDVSDKNSLSAFFAEIGSAQISPSILVNNAAITRDNLLLRMKDDEWNQVIETNLSSVFQLCRHFIRPMLKARFGRIINLTSVVGISGNPGQANYAAAKAGLIGFGKSLAAEVANRNITVNAIAPGLIDTDMTRALTEGQREAVLSRIPAGRLGSGEEIASLALYLASDLAGYITGETIHVNGGMYMG